MCLERPSHVEEPVFGEIYYSKRVSGVQEAGNLVVVGNVLLEIQGICGRSGESERG